MTINKSTKRDQINGKTRKLTAMAKNRRKSNAPGTPSETPVSKRRKTEVSGDLYDKLKQVVLDVYKLTDSQGYEIATDFLELPSKTEYPDYYQEIEKPISMAEINRKITKKEYSSGLEFIQDFKLMADNASQYNEEDSLIAQNALTILSTVKSAVEQLEPHAPLPKIKLRLGGHHAPPAPAAAPATPSTPTSSSEKPDLKQRFTEIIDELINFEDNEVRIGEPFIEEVSRKDYPNYYKLIKHAMAFSTVKKNINLNKYKTIDDLVKHVDLIWHNAQLYNEEGSLIYEDSKTLQNHFDSLIQQLKKESTIPEEEEEEDGDDEPEDSIMEDFTMEDSILDTPQEVLKDTQVEEIEVETPMKKKLGRPRGRPAKSKLNIVQDVEEEEIPEPVIPEFIPEPYVPIAYSILNVPSNVANDELSLPQNYISKILETIKARVNQSPIKDSHIEEITVSSSRSIYRQSVKSTNNGQLPTLFQNWFEYKFLATEKPSKNFSITLPPQQSAVSVAAGLSDSLIKIKHTAALTVNGERVNPTPSIHYADNGRTLTSRYELKLPMGLNKVSFDLNIENGQGLFADEETRSSRSNDGSIQESLVFWIEVS